MQNEIRELEISLTESELAYVRQAEEITVTDAESERKAAELFAAASATVKRIEEERLLFVAPLTATSKRFNEKAKQISLPFVTVKEILSKKMSEYRTREDIRQKEYARNQAERDADREIDNGNFAKANEALVRKEELAAEVSKTVVAEQGKIQFRSSLVIDSIDIDKLPKRYCLPDESLIKADLKSGIAVPGVVAHEERRPVSYSKK